jgi:hypothetical protein
MPLNEFRNLKENGSASAAELAEFLVQLRGKRPQEVLGLVAQSGLTRGMVTATVMVGAILAVFTVTPYAWSKMFPGKAQVAEKQAAQPAAAKTPAEAPASAPEAAPAAPAEKPSQQEIMQKLGVGEAKPSDPLSNPLENRTDDLLKDLK